MIHVVLVCAALLVQESEPMKKERPHRKSVGVFYMPAPEKAEEIERIVRGNPGGRQGFNLTLAPVAYFADGEYTRVPWRDRLEAAEKFGGGKLQCVIDVHVLIADEWLYADNADKLYNLIVEIIQSEHASTVAGWYICDEPLAKSLKSRENPVDIKRIWDLVNVIRRAERDTKKKQVIYADYGSVLPLLKKGGDPVNGGWYDYTDRKDQREVFLWGTEWVERVVDKQYNGGRPIVRGYGCFGEDVTLINWYNTAEQLQRWMKRIVKDVPAEQIQIVTGYDLSESTPENNDAWLQRIRAVIEQGEKLGVAGYWLWPWSTTKTSRTYKGVSTWWENDPEDRRYPKRYADLIESIP